MGSTVGRSLAMALLLVTILTFSLATIYSSPVSDNKVSCPEGWVDANDLDMGCLLMHHSELNHKVHTWPKSDEFCREFGENSRMVEVHTIKQKEFLDQLVANEGDWIWGSTGGSGEPVQDFVWAPKQGNDGKLHNCMFWTWEMIGETQFLGGADDMCNILLGVYPLCQMV